MSRTIRPTTGRGDAHRAWLPFALLLSFSVASAAVSSQGDQQAPAATPTKPGAAAPAQAGQAGAYTYNPEGRRDPFVSLVSRGFDMGGGRRQGRPPEGVAGMAVADLILKGVFQSRGKHVAIVQGPDNRSYIVRVNDRLYDGFVRAITPNEIVLIQEVNDPLSVSKQREVRRPLRVNSEPK